MCAYAEGTHRQRRVWLAQKRREQHLEVFPSDLKRELGALGKQNVGGPDLNIELIGLSWFEWLMFVMAVVRRAR